jgi:hypothetical protein
MLTRPFIAHSTTEEGVITALGPDPVRSTIIKQKHQISKRRKSRRENNGQKQAV